MDNIVSKFKIHGLKGQQKFILDEKIKICNSFTYKWLGVGKSRLSTLNERLNEIDKRIENLKKIGSTKLNGQL
jgi:hypothetical protein